VARLLSTRRNLAHTPPPPKPPPAESSDARAFLGGLYLLQSPEVYASAKPLRAASDWQRCTNSFAEERTGVS
jgi:hypothetical protein